MQSGIQVQYAGDSISQVRAYKTVWLYNGSGASIATGQAVALDTSVTPPGGTAGVASIRTPNGNQDTLVVGAALRAIPNLTWGEVVVQGVQAGVISAGAIAAGGLIECINAAGQVAAMTAPAETKIAPIGRAVAAASGGTPGTVTVEWFNVYDL